MKFIEYHETSPDTVSLHLVDNRLIRNIYHPPSTTPAGLILTAMKKGEIRMGDFNCPHPSWKEDDPETPQGKVLHEWLIREEAEERSPPDATHTRGRKLDLIITKDDPKNDIVSKIFHNGHVEHSDHSCQSIMIPLTIPLETIPAKTNYRKINMEALMDRIGKLREPASPQC